MLVVILLYLKPNIRISHLYIDTGDSLEAAGKTSEATGKSEAPRRKSKVMITETSTTSIPRPVAEVLKKSVLKSVSGGSMDIPTTDKMLDVKTTEVRSPSPIPEDPVGEEDKRSIATPDREKKPEEKNKDGKEEDGKEEDKAKEDKTKGTSERLEKSKEQTESKMVQDEDKRQKPESSREATAKGTDSDERKASAVSQKEKVSKSPVIQATTSERGKSKATGKITGGWI